jgi:SPP1 gp7 family putative phage head morphogenesis protein
LSKDGTERLCPYLDDIRTILEDGAKAGESPFEVAETLGDRFDKYSSYEFERLARTEMSAAANQGQQDEYAAEGITDYEWAVSGLACAICSAFAGQVFKVGSGPVPPGDSHPQCLCSTKPVVPEG